MKHMGNICSILERTFSKREEAAVLHAGGHQGCSEKQERKGGRGSDKAPVKFKKKAD